jgi:tricorn protease
VVVDPVPDDRSIRRLAWMEQNRQRVERLSDGRLGYVALSNFSDEGSKEFVREFYPQLDKQGPHPAETAATDNLKPYRE